MAMLATASIPIQSVLTLPRPSSARTRFLSNGTATKSNNSMKRTRSQSSTSVTSSARWSALPEAVQHEMVSYFSVEELLVLEQVDPLWQIAIANAGTWNTFILRNERDDEANERLIEQVATRHGRQVQCLKLINSAFSDEAIVALGANFTSVTELVVSGCKTLSDAGLAALLSASSQSLVELRAVKCPLLTDSSLSLLGSQHGAVLRRVDFSHCRLVTSEGVRALVSTSNDLQSFGLKGCPKVNDATVLLLAASCPSLEVLAVGGSGTITDNALIALGEQCSGLMSLDIAHSNPFGMGRTGVTDVGLTHLITKCRSLEHLVLRGQGNLSVAVLSTLAQHSSNLRSLEIGGCRGIVQNPLALCGALKGLAVLEHLSVSFCRGLTEEDIHSIATECSQLKSFDVDGRAVVPRSS
ncbi:TPA: hypothetical protein N0F65_010836 [Lagenidium giganteum]|uniref:Uncharacterized protein n=1 Tax=Lagenidium giganteum TaxID=4803 RepID=A0AAV2Z763_9STRA|nr:TPA: hypothetical protein N0F65_010836 [Lagenidium giganteum]